MAWNPPPMYRIRSVGDDPVPAAPAQSNVMLYHLLLAGAGAAVYFLTQPQKGGGSVGGYSGSKKKFDKSVEDPPIYVEERDEDWNEVAHPKSWQVRELMQTRASGGEDGDSKEVIRARSVTDAKRFIQDSMAYRQDTGPLDYWSYFIAPSKKPPGDP